MWKKFWNDEAGFVVTVELTLVASLLVMGLAAGLGTLRDAVTQEIKDTAKAFGALNQGSNIGTSGEESPSATNLFLNAAEGIDVKASTRESTINEI